MLETSRRDDSVSSKDRQIRIEDSVKLSQDILHCARGGLPRAEFLEEVTNLLLDFSECDAMEIRLSDGSLHYCWEVTRRPGRGIRFDLAQWIVEEDGTVIPATAADSGLEWVCRHVARQQFDSRLLCFTDTGSFWTGNTARPLSLLATARLEGGSENLHIGGQYGSLIAIRFFVTSLTVGLLLLKSRQPDSFSAEEVEFYEGLAQTLGLAVADRRAEAAVRERVKELTCLYGISNIAESETTPLSGMLQHMVHLLPPAWQYPEVAAARISLDGDAHVTPEFRESRYRQSADIVVSGRTRGKVEVVYLEERPEFPVDVFLPEEEKLIDAVAREVSLIVERRESQEERSKLNHQLIHADRLATIGQLAAGVAHELNEPLGSILGFAQLAAKCPDIPRQAQKDIDRIVSASLYARDVIKKLLVFARQMPPSVAPVSLNQVIADGLHFHEARCAKAGIEIVRNLADGLPKVEADPAQVNQVLVNLVVNAVHAMPEGGTLTISTRSEDGKVMLVIGDTGVGMSEEMIDKIFLPFFTTKEIDEGTGLGLAVVHGIVTSHGGSIDVESQFGKGSRFTVHLPTCGSRAVDDDEHGRRQ
ncbi:MAG: sensor histidine kinase [Planctomycetota bacterium]|jgi:signal transduction histidine kinase